MSKPNRKQLIRVIQELQDLLGQARGAALDDRNINRMRDLLRPLDQGFDLCVESLQYDPPASGRKSNK